MGAAGVLLRLHLLSLISVVWPLNPDDPNVCSHWERSVLPPRPHTHTHTLPQINTEG